MRVLHTHTHPAEKKREGEVECERERDPRGPKRAHGLMGIDGPGGGGESIVRFVQPEFTKKFPQPTTPMMCARERELAICFVVRAYITCSSAFLWRVALSRMYNIKERDG